MADIINSLCDTCCNIASKDNLIFETVFWRVILAADQAYLGRSFVTLKNHKESLSELSSDEWDDFRILVNRIENGYEKALNSGRPFNWACMMNNAYKEPEPTPHVHWHVRPRHSESISVGSTEYIDPEYAHHYDRSRKAFVDNTALEEIIKLIKTNI